MPKKEKWDFTKEQIDELPGLAARGATNEDLAGHFGVCEKTIRRALKRNPKAAQARHSGKVRAMLNVSGRIYEMAMKSDNPAWALFYAKTQMGWREVNRTEHGGIDGKPIETKNEHEIKLTIKDYRADGAD